MDAAEGPDLAVDDRSGGPADGWQATYLAHADRLVRLATVLVGPDDAADLVSEAVRRAVTSSAWRGVREPGAYLTTTLVNEVRQAERGRRRRERREDRAHRLTVVVPTDAAPDLDVRRALGALSPQQRAVVFLTYWEDLGIDQVAAALDVTGGTVRRQLARAKTTLEEQLHD